MTPSAPASFDALRYPYALSDDAQTRLTQLQGLLNTLSLLSGKVAFHDPNGTPEMNNDTLGNAFWGLSDLLDGVVDSMITRPFNKPAVAQGAQS